MVPGQVSVAVSCEALDVGRYTASTLWHGLVLAKQRRHEVFPVALPKAQRTCPVVHTTLPQRGKQGKGCNNWCEQTGVYLRLRSRRSSFARSPPSAIQAPPGLPSCSIGLVGVCSVRWLAIMDCAGALAGAPYVGRSGGGHKALPELLLDPLGSEGSDRGELTGHRRSALNLGRHGDPGQQAAQAHVSVPIQRCSCRVK